MALCPSGTQAAWQVEYPDDQGVNYWWDYDESVVKGLENARKNDELLRFVWAWPNGKVSEYEADPKRGLVANVGTEHGRKLRRLFVQCSPSADAEMQEQEDQPGAEPGEEKVRWQVAYERRGVEYWWDYDTNVSLGLEQSLRSGKLLGFDWDWGPRKSGEISEYVADPMLGIVVNQKTQFARKIRRVFLA